MHHENASGSGAEHKDRGRPLHTGTAFSHFCGDASGSAAIEYTLIAGIVGLGLIAALAVFKLDLVASFGGITNTLLKY